MKLQTAAVPFTRCDPQLFLECELTYSTSLVLRCMLAGRASLRSSLSSPSAAAAAAAPVSSDWTGRSVMASRYLASCLSSPIMASEVMVPLVKTRVTSRSASWPLRRGCAEAEGPKEFEETRFT